MCGGPSAAQENLAAEQADFYKTQVQAYNTAYANFSTLQQTLNQQFAPILAAGPGQRGFTDEERNALLTQAKEGTASGFRKATQAAQSSYAARGGGNDTTNITSGEAAQTDADLAATAASSESAEELGITQSDYALGRQQYEEAVQGEEDLAAGWNPSSFAGSATNAGDLASKSAEAITQEQESIWGNVEGALGGAVGDWAGAGFKV